MIHSTPQRKPSRKTPHPKVGVVNGRWRALVVCALAAGGVLALSASRGAWAQPPVLDEGARMERERQGVRYAWRELQREMAPVELTDPARAVAAYQKFYEKNGHLYVDVAVAVTSRTAQLWGRALHNPAKAGEIYAWALEQWGETTYKERLQREAALMARLSAKSANAGATAEATAPVAVESATMKAATVEPVTVTSQLSLALALEEMRAGRLSAHAAWERGSLSVEDALRLLEQTGEWGGFAQGRNHEMRRGVALLVANQAPQLLQVSPETGKTPLAVNTQLWIGEALARANDARTAPLLENVLSQLEAQGQVKDGLYFIAVENLGAYYDRDKQFDKAVQTWLRLDAIESRAPVGWLEAARSYARAGQTEKSRELYARVPQAGHGWLSVLSLYDQALPLLDAGKLAEARAIFERPLELTSNQTEGRVAQNAWLASIAYRQGDLESAFRYGQQMKAEAAKGEITHDNVRGLYNMGLDIYNRAGGWRTQPIQTDTKEVVFQTNPSQPDQPLYARFRIKTYGDTSVTATVDNPAFQARVLPLDNWQREGLNAHEQEMEVVVTTSLNRPVANVPLVLSSAARGKTTTVRLSLREESPRPALSTGG